MGWLRKTSIRHARNDDVSVHPKKVCPQMPKIHPQKSQVEMADMEMVEINGAESSANAGITSTAMMLSMTSTTLPKVGLLGI